MDKGVQVTIPFTDEKMWVDDTKVKAPKLRFKPGMVFVYEGEIVLVRAAFRTREDDREWLYQCTVISRKVTEETMRNSSYRAKDYDPNEEPKTVVYWLFRDSLAAFSYFNWVMNGGDSRIIRNKDLVQKGTRLFPEPVQSERV